MAEAKKRRDSVKDLEELWDYYRAECVGRDPAIQYGMLVKVLANSVGKKKPKATRASSATAPASP